MLATLTKPEDFGDEDGWAFEMKWDGVRTVAYLAGGRVKLLSRKGRDDTAAYFDVVDDLAALQVETAVLDGEMVVTDAGRTAELRAAAAPDQPHPARRHRAGGRDLAGPADALRHPGAQRRSPWSRAVRASAGRSSRTWSSRSRGRGCRCRRSSTATWTRPATSPASSRLEGVVAKRVDSVYQPGRRAPTWLKMKLHPHQEVVIAGWRPGQGRRDGGIGSLLMGIPTPDGLRYVGKVGSGFDDRKLDDLMAPAGAAGPRRPRRWSRCRGRTPATRTGWSPSSSARSATAS